MRPTSEAAAALACAALFLLAGCATGTPRQPMIPSGRYAVSTDTPASFDGARIMLVSVADSRCPPDVTCIWAGRIEYRFALEAGGSTEPFTLTSDAPSQRLAAVPVTASLVKESIEPVLPSKAPQRATHTVTLDITPN